MSPVVTRLAVYGLMFLVAFGSGAFWQRGHDAKAYAALSAEYAQFKGGVEAAGRERQAANARQALADIKAKEHADEEQKRRADRQRARIVELRDETDSRGGGVAAPAPSAVCPEELACFDRDTFERARREFIAEIRRLADEGTAVERALRIAREWSSVPAP